MGQGWLVSRAYCRASRLTQACSRAQLTTHAVRRDLNRQLIYSVASAEARMVRSSTREWGVSITSQCSCRFIDHTRTRLQHPIHRPLKFCTEAGIALYRRPEGRPNLACSKAHGRLKQYHHPSAEWTENQEIPSSVRSFLRSASVSLGSELKKQVCASKAFDGDQFTSSRACMSSCSCCWLCCRKRRGLLRPRRERGSESSNISEL